MGKKTNNKKQEQKHKINNDIRAYKVKLVGDNITQGVYSRNDALKMADEMGLDLVEVSPNQDPPICKIMDYKKFLYKQKKNSKQPDKIVMKEIRFKPFIDEADFERKTQQAIKFLEKGYKVKLDCLFVGRGWEHKRDSILKRTYTLLDDVSEVGTPEQLPKIQGVKMVCIIRPKKK